ncbi:MAG: type I-C CRISPR-associated protein Cas5 [Verrucomicrobia bacterium]|nr:type I-C CRISPR-associated protein Cas5 [Verrucomicrobiota bacterium]
MNERIHLRTWGDLACFTRPEMKVERVSYPVMTPSAARGLLESILYKPQFRWRVHRIAVRKPIRFLSIRRNEVKETISETQFKAAANGEPVEVIIADDTTNKNKGRTQRNTLALREVEYVIEASLELTSLANRPRRKPPCEDEPDGDDNPPKYFGMFRRRAESGQCFARPCFGCREFPADFELADETAMRVEPNPNVDTDLGLMLYDVFDLDMMHELGRVQASPQRTFFPARLEKGLVTIPAWTEIKHQLGGAA